MYRSLIGRIKPRVTDEDYAFTALYQQLADRVTRYIAVRVGTTQIAEDLAAQTFLKALEAMRRGKGGTEYASVGVRDCTARGGRPLPAPPPDHPAGSYPGCCGGWSQPWQKSQINNSSLNVSPRPSQPSHQIGRKPSRYASLAGFLPPKRLRYWTSHHKPSRCSSIGLYKIYRSV